MADEGNDVPGQRIARVPKTALHFIGALAAVVGLCAAMLIMILVTLNRLEVAEQEVEHLDHAKHAAHIMEAQVREQYIHQAHSIIEMGLTHERHYRAVVKTTQAAIARLQRLTRRPEDRQKADELARLARRNDRQFREYVIPAIRQGRRDKLVALHGALEPIVTHVTRVNAELSEILNGRSAAARVRADALRAKTTTMAVLCFVLALLVAGVVATVLTRRIGGRIGALRTGAMRLSSGDLESRIELTGDDEFVQLAQTFNQMATDLGEHQRRLLRSERLASIGQVAAGVAHEINNPLGVILGYVKLLKPKIGDPHAETIQILEDETRHCQRIVDDLLELARPRDLRLDDVNLDALASDVVQRLGDSGKLEDVTVEVSSRDNVVLARADEEQLRQVLDNLVVNAAEAAGPGGSVALSAKRDGGEATLSVEDSGPGMADDVRARAFEPFFTTKRTGVGLGLAIAHAIVDAHGGRLSIAIPPDGGTRLTVHLPLTGKGAIT